MTQRSTLCKTAYWLLPIVLLSASATAALAQNQTSTYTPLSSASDLSFRIEVKAVDTSAMQLPTLQSYASAQYDGKWILFGGRTNGLHGFDTTGSLNFPAASQNTDVWVIDPVTQQSWHRSLSDASSGLSAAAIASLTIANTQTLQKGSNLYIIGGYGQTASGTNGTLDTLSAVSLPGMMQWAMGGSGAAAAYVRQTSDPSLKVTGGGLVELNGRMQLVMGQNFTGDYTPGRSGAYTRQIRSFDLVDDGVTVRAENWSATTADNNYHRRDLNVVPVIRPDGAGGVQDAAAALGGVFTATNGAWTVPVSIDESGHPSMVDAAESSSFKQGFNGYEAANVGLYSSAAGTMHTLLFGGISLQTLDAATGQVITDNNMPFVNDITDVSIDADGNYSQRHVGYFPTILDENGKQLLFGTDAHFFASTGLTEFDNGVIDLESITGATRLGYIFGGIESNSPNTQGVPGAITGASNTMFEVLLVPVPEPSTTVLILAGLGFVALRQRKTIKRCS